MLTKPLLSREQADALGSRITLALRGAGGNPTALYLEAREEGLLVMATINGKQVAAVVPPDHQASYQGIAETLLMEAAMALPQPKDPKTIWAD